MSQSLQDQIDAIDKAINSGAKVVEYDDQRVEYRSLNDMLKIRDLLKKKARGGGSAVTPETEEKALARWGMSFATVNRGT